jgi:hypothetical protein
MKTSIIAPFSGYFLELEQKPRLGEEIKLTEVDFNRLSQASFDEIEAKFTSK